MFSCCWLLISGEQHTDYENFKNIFKIRKDISQHVKASVNSISDLTSETKIHEFRSKNMRIDTLSLKMEINVLDSLLNLCHSLHSSYLMESTKLIHKWSEVFIKFEHPYNMNVCNTLIEEYKKKENMINRLFSSYLEIVSTIKEYYIEYYRVKSLNPENEIGWDRISAKITDYDSSIKLIDMGYHCFNINLEIDWEQIYTFDISKNLIDLLIILDNYLDKKQKAKFRYENSVQKITETALRHYEDFELNIFRSFWHEESINDLVIIMDNYLLFKESTLGIILKDKVNRKEVKKIQTFIKNTRSLVKKYDPPL